MAEISELRKTVNVNIALRLETIRLMNNADPRMKIQVERIATLQKELRREQFAYQSMQSQAASGGIIIDECNRRLQALRNELVLETRKALIEKAQRLVGLRKSLEENDPDDVPVEMIS